MLSWNYEIGGADLNNNKGIEAISWVFIAILLIIFSFSGFFLIVGEGVVPNIHHTQVSLFLENIWLWHSIPLAFPVTFCRGCGFLQLQNQLSSIWHHIRGYAQSPAVSVSMRPRFSPPSRLGARVWLLFKLTNQRQAPWHLRGRMRDII